MVAIARESSSACAAASPAARESYNELEAMGPSRSDIGGGAVGPTKKDSGASTGSFFGKIQNVMDSAVQKVDKMLTTSKPDPRLQQTAPPTPELQQGVPTRPATQRGAPGSAPGAPSMSPEEEQLQWALSASLADAQGMPPASGASKLPHNSGRPQMQFQDAANIAPAVIMGRPPHEKVATGQPPSGMGPRDSQSAMGFAGAQGAGGQLQALEDRAVRAERELAAAQAREASAAAQRAQLQQQLRENETLIRGLTEQIDMANSQLDSKTSQCKALQDALAAAQHASAATAAAAVRDDEASESERQGTIAQLLTRIAELESTLLRATHFAPADDAQECETTPETSREAVDPLLPVAADSASDPIATLAAGPCAAAAAEAIDPVVISGIAAPATETTAVVEAAAAAEESTASPQNMKEAPKLPSSTSDVSAGIEEAAPADDAVASMLESSDHAQTTTTVPASSLESSDNVDATPPDFVPPSRNLDDGTKPPDTAEEF